MTTPNRRGRVFKLASLLFASSTCQQTSTASGDASVPTPPDVTGPSSRVRIEIGHCDFVGWGALCACHVTTLSGPAIPTSVTLSADAGGPISAAIDTTPSPPLELEVARGVDVPRGDPFHHHQSLVADDARFWRILRVVAAPPSPARVRR